MLVHTNCPPYALNGSILQQYALKGQKLVAQGSALGKHVINKVAL